MLLAKRCHAKDHIRSRNTVKLGTLYEYRETEIQEIADAHEGTYNLTMRFLGNVPLDAVWFNTILGHSLVVLGPGNGGSPISLPGRTSTKIWRLQHRLLDEHTIEVVDSTIDIRREVFNSFIFCMSQVRRTADALQIFPHYDSQWYMSAHRAVDFGYQLGKLLIQEIHKKRAQGIHVIPEDLDLNKLGLEFKYGLVKYAPRDITFSKESDLTVDQILPTLANMSFLKTPNYQHEKEYRFQYTLIYNGEIIEPSVRSIIITDAEKLLNLII